MGSTTMVSEMDVDDALPAKDIASAFYQKYELREVLGRGVSSTVRRAVLKETGESFAAKIIDVSEDAVDGDGLSLKEQTVREVNILRLVSGHDNIIQLVDMFESVTYIFLIFELCVNGELFDHLNSVVTISEKRARRIIRQVTSELEPLICLPDHILHNLLCHKTLFYSLLIETGGRSTAALSQERGGPPGHQARKYPP